jgi:phospholipid/cholesterol/gamma-HCH transport system permease protein
MHLANIPSLELITSIENNADTSCVTLTGAWLAHLVTHTSVTAHLQQQLTRAASQSTATTNIVWDLRQIVSLDHIGAQMIWNVWGKRFPPSVQILEAHQGLFDRLEKIGQLQQQVIPKPQIFPLERLGKFSLKFASHIVGMTELVGQLTLDLMRFARHPSLGPWKEISANVYRTGFQALFITALVGLLIGVVLSYLTAQQLRQYGGDLFIVNLLGVSIVRELGPMLAAILIAGRSGSAMTAQLGVMRVTEELDAMRVMGIPLGFRLIMPKVIALAFTMPMIVIWTDVMALLGGMFAANLILDMPAAFFIHQLPEAVSLANFWIGLGKGVVFGILISLVACHYGLRIKPNTESLGQGTTSSVVVSITAVIIADAIFAVIFSEIGY